MVLTLRPATLAHSRRDAHQVTKDELCIVILMRHIGTEYRAYHKTAAYQKAIRKRKVWVEPLFAEAKEWHGLRQFRLRRLWRVNLEALLIGAGQNLKRLMAKRGWGRRPP